MKTTNQRKLTRSLEKVEMGFDDVKKLFEFCSFFLTVISRRLSLINFETFKCENAKITRNWRQISYF